MLHDSHSAHDTSSSNEERLTAFGVIFGQAIVQWNGSGRPFAKATKPVESNRSTASAVDVANGDLRYRIAKVLEKHGPQAPGTIGIRVQRSHRLVHEALKSLMELGVVSATGSTRGRKYSLRPDWRDSLATGIEQGILAKQSQTIE